MAGFLWYVFWQVAGIYISCCVFRQSRVTVRLWLGSVFGSVLSIWTPIPFAFIWGFTIVSHSLAVCFGGIVWILLVRSKRNRTCVPPAYPISFRYDLPLLTLVLPVFLYCTWLIVTHTLKPYHGALYTGQCTYGDMSMHLGFITSIAEQGRKFPPEYNILPGVLVCYPFLCDSVSSSLYLLGMDLRTAYILPMIFAFAQVLSGVWFLAIEICKKRKLAVLSWTLFFFNGGLGLIYFGKGQDYSWNDLLTGFYKTPTNLVDKQIRWVNIIADMLLPQRATLFGWTVLMAAFFLLFRAVFRADSRLWFPAGILGGLIPMIHTHSFFALGLVAACWMAYSLVDSKLSKEMLYGWLMFGLPAVCLAVPQLLVWTLRSVAGNSHFLRYNFDWVNGGKENWFWFWLRNAGPMFFLFPISFLFAAREKRAIASGSVFIFILCEFFAFQPNVYDNNKLLYIGYLFSLFLSTEVLLNALDSLRSNFMKKTILLILLLICTNAAILTLLREGLSGIPKYGYELFSSDETAAASYINDHTDPNAIFLTDDNHDNTVAVLTGRNILCGSASYLYFHGVDYKAEQQLAEKMLTNAAFFEAYKDAENVDYVYIGYSESFLPNNIRLYLSQHYPTVFSSGGITIFDVKDAG